MEKFKKLKLSENLLKALKELDFKEPTEIQEKSIPLILKGKDVLGSSATGSGKTLAFGSGIIENTGKGEGLQALILTPTRELAKQITTSLRRFSKYYSLKITEIYGGVAFNPQVRELKKVEIVVGTPGRILDHIQRKTIDLSKINFLVLDEADRMLEMGFIEDVTKIIKKCPDKRQTLLFSATIPLEIEKISERYMRNPALISVESYVDPKKLSQSFFDVPSHLKFSLLVHLLKQEKSGLVMVFCNTRRNVDLIAKNLKRYEIDSLAIHGGLPQNKRSNIMKLFHSNNVSVLVCTDVAARGLDIKGVSHVYNYDSPKNSTEYIHRIGRTARAGKEGKAISIVSQKDYENFRNVNTNDSLNIKRETLPNVEQLDVNFQVADRGGRDFKNRNFRERSDSRRGNSRGRFNSRGRSNSGGRYSGGRSFGRRASESNDSGRPTFRRDSRKLDSGRSSGRREFGRRDSNSERGNNSTRGRPNTKRVSGNRVNSRERSNLRSTGSGRKSFSKRNRK